MCLHHWAALLQLGHRYGKNLPWVADNLNSGPRINIHGAELRSWPYNPSNMHSCLLACPAEISQLKLSTNKNKWLSFYASERRNDLLHGSGWLLQASLEVAVLGPWLDAKTWKSNPTLMEFEITRRTKICTQINKPELHETANIWPFLTYEITNSYSFNLKLFLKK